MNKPGMYTRAFSNFQARSVLTAENEKQYIVEGYAAVFDTPTVLFSWEGLDYHEQIDRHAFDDCDMSDVIFNFNHAGRVFARTRNKTLQLSIDEKGLLATCNVGKTEEGRKLFEEIEGGYLDRMSFRFSIGEESYDRDKRLWTVRKIKKLYDVSAVDFPAYDDTSIGAKRSLLEADAQRRKAELDSLKLREEMLIKMKLL